MAERSQTRRVDSLRSLTIAPERVLSGHATEAFNMRNPCFRGLKLKIIPGKENAFERVYTVYGGAADCIDYLKQQAIMSEGLRLTPNSTSLRQ